MKQRGTSSFVHDGFRVLVYVFEKKALPGLSG